MDLSPFETFTFVVAGISMLLALVLLAMGATLVRSVSASAGYAVAAAGGVRAFVAFCGDVVIYRARLQDDAPAEALGSASSCLHAVGHAAFWGLLMFAAVTVAREARR
ncbi:hypothetical protein [Sandaracinus amylolyticus]|uniref:hypothetical protein n=1 Tax=Sandaracinus amylolyticus TaxID=927083 RepID=UPI001F2263DB|nr:hypothetical protein [Sandaracinus amylolyticus]UJR78515.1 Hypothetical protein I5071_5450 [Sandaracinus amylolyticus]